MYYSSTMVHAAAAQSRNRRNRRCHAHGYLDWRWVRGSVETPVPWESWALLAINLETSKNVVHSQVGVCAWLRALPHVRTSAHGCTTARLQRLHAFQLGWIMESSDLGTSASHSAARGFGLFACGPLQCLHRVHSSPIYPSHRPSIWPYWRRFSRRWSHGPWMCFAWH